MKNVEKLQREFNTISIGSIKLYVNILRFGRNEVKQDRQEQTNVES